MEKDPSLLPQRILTDKKDDRKSLPFYFKNFSKADFIEFMQNCFDVVDSCKICDETKIYLTELLCRIQSCENK